jgi:hypothetical protein
LMHACQDLTLTQRVPKTIKNKSDKINQAATNSATEVAISSNITYSNTVEGNICYKQNFQSNSITEADRRIFSS